MKILVEKQVKTEMETAKSKIEGLNEHDENPKKTPDDLVKEQ